MAVDRSLKDIVREARIEKPGMHWIEEEYCDLCEGARGWTVVYLGPDRISATPGVCTCEDPAEPAMQAIVLFAYQIPQIFELPEPPADEDAVRFVLALSRRSTGHAYEYRGVADATPEGWKQKGFVSEPLSWIEADVGDPTARFSTEVVAEKARNFLPCAIKPAKC